MTAKRINLLFFYLLTGMMLLAMKYFYSKAGSDDLDWILAPTARWAGFLGGIPFTRKAGAGYVNQNVRFVIAASCSGVQFMMIAAATLIFPYLRRMKTTWGRLCLLGGGLTVAYGYTVFVNGLRIVLSIYLPPLFRDFRLYRGWLTPERIHTMVGIGCFFTALLVLSHVAGLVFHAARLEKGEKASTFSAIFRKCIPPIFWYFLIALGIPLMNRAYQNNGKNFLEYALLMVGICGGLSLLFVLGRGIKLKMNLLTSRSKGLNGNGEVSPRARNNHPHRRAIQNVP